LATGIAVWIVQAYDGGMDLRLRLRNPGFVPFAKDGRRYFSAYLTGTAG
jgi:hypothetical protein